jgi:hypothetical protein
MEEFEHWLDRIPKNCGCMKKVRAILAHTPPDFENWFPWTVWFHNEVNCSLNHPIVSMERARMLWRHERPETNRSRCVVTVAHGLDAIELLAVTKPLMQEYADRCDADLIDLDNETEEWWGLEKFRTWHFAKQYEECLFLDADVIVRPGCPSLFGRESLVAMHDDFGFLDRSDWLAQEREMVSQRSGMPIPSATTCFNSGVVYTRREAADTWLPPTVDIGQSHCAEQLVVESQAMRFNPEKLESKFNWQWYFKDFSKGIKNSWMIHLANCPSKIENAKGIISKLNAN